MTTQSDDFVTRAQSLQGRLGLTDEAFAAYLGVPVPTLRKWYAKGENNRSPNSSAVRLLEVFEILSTFCPAINNTFIKR